MVANKRMNADRGIPRGSAALHTPAGYARRYLEKKMSFIRPLRALPLVGFLLVAVLFGGCGTTRAVTKERAGHIGLSYVRQHYRKNYSYLTRSVMGAQPGVHHIEREGNVWRVQVFVGGAKMIPQMHSMSVDDAGHITNHTTKDFPAKSGPPPIPGE